MESNEKSVGPSTNVTISISSPKLSSNCEEVVQTLKHLGIMSNITPNRTIFTPNNDIASTVRVRTEQGCRIIFGVPPEKNIHKEVEKVWKIVKKKHNLTCAHVNVNHNWSGCIYDYLRPSSCPGNKSKFPPFF